MIVRTLIVDDEPLARQTLRDFCAGVGSLDLVGEATNGSEAVQLIDELRPDLVFLDVNMPELSGLQVLERVVHEPAVVFTTAYDSYAVPAFELQALDYLLKPFGRERFHKAVERATAHIAGAMRAPRVAERAREALSPGPILERLFVHRQKQIVPVQVREVVRIQAAGDYSELYVSGSKYLVGTTLGALANRLDPLRFLRVHRSHIVNVDHIKAMEPYDERRLAVNMADGSEIIASRAGSQLLRRLVP